MTSLKPASVLLSTLAGFSLEVHGGPAASRFVSVLVESGSGCVAATPSRCEFSLPNLSDIVPNQNQNMSMTVRIYQGDLELEQLDQFL